MRYFTDGGVLSNTPFRELLSAHKEYWKDVEKVDEIPDLDVCIINVHASIVDAGKVREDYDGVKDSTAPGCAKLVKVIDDGTIPTV